MTAIWIFLARLLDIFLHFHVAFFVVTLDGWGKKGKEKKNENLLDKFQVIGCLTLLFFFLICRWLILEKETFFAVSTYISF